MQETNNTNGSGNDNNDLPKTLTIEQKSGNGKPGKEVEVQIGGKLADNVGALLSGNKDLSQMSSDEIAAMKNAALAARKIRQG